MNLELSILPSVPAPQGFKPAGRVLAAEFALPPALRKRRYTGRRLEGIRYERRAQEHLADFYGDRYLPSPWLRFFTGGQWRWCQPDAILIDLEHGRITIVEIKYQHTPDAWWQVRQLYQPVLSAMFPPELWSFEACEVVKWYDPNTLFPEKTVLAQEPGLEHSSFKVHIWRP